MITTATAKNGKHTAEVRDGDRVLYRSPEFITERMALADAGCWAAFHGERDGMGKVEVDLNEVYTTRQAETLVFAEVPAGDVARSVANAYAHGLTVEIKSGAMSQRYIEISNGKGSAYGQYHIGADFRERVTNHQR
jgi:hypothetical protein